MSRPYKLRRVKYCRELFFKPAGIRMANLQKVILEADEYEAIRFADVNCLSYEEAGRKMNISRQTFGRIIERAREKIADAIVNCKAILITTKGPVRMMKVSFICLKCGYKWSDIMSNSKVCPECKEPLDFPVKV